MKIPSIAQHATTNYYDNGAIIFIYHVQVNAFGVFYHIFIHYSYFLYSMPSCMGKFLYKNKIIR